MSDVPVDVEEIPEGRIVEDIENTNKIYFFSEIEDDQVFKLEKIILEKSYKIIDLHNRYNIPIMPIELHINSNGGSIFPAFAASDLIANNFVPVHTYIKGIAASSATFLSLVGKKRFITERSFMMIHGMSSWLGNDFFKYHEIKNEQENADKFHKAMKDFYTKHTKIPPKRLNEILKQEVYFDSKECLKYGLVDEVI